MLYLGILYNEQYSKYMNVSDKIAIIKILL